MAIYNGYGDMQVYLVEPSLEDYSTPNGTFKTYWICSKEGFASGLRIQMSRTMAENFASKNSLTIITESRHREIIECFTNNEWPESNE